MNTKYVASIVKSNWKWLLTSLGILIGLPILTYLQPITGIICFTVVCIYQKIKIRVQKEYIREIEDDMFDEDEDTLEDLTIDIKCEIIKEE